MLPATPEADELQQLPLELPRYLLVALRESGGHRAYALLPPHDGWATRCGKHWRIRITHAVWPSLNTEPIFRSGANEQV